MGTPVEPQATGPLTVPPPTVLICGIIAQSEELAAGSEKLLVSEFGPVAERSAVIPFDFTDYYEPEMGTGLLRSWLAFSRPVPPDRLVETKLATIRLERQLSASFGNRQSKIGDRQSAARPSNLDPGLLSLYNLVLASTKDHAHRIYLGSGIHAELTLIFRSGRFEPLPWTYPDYRTGACFEFLLRCRGLLKA
jgi:hypothetical protein